MIADMKHLKQICSGKIEEIENFSEAINDSKHMWDLHHKLGLNHSIEELKEAGLYFHRPANELEFLRRTTDIVDVYDSLKTHKGKHADAKRRIESEFEFTSYIDRISREQCKDSKIVNDKVRFETWIESLLRYEMITKRLDIEMLSVHTGLKEEFIDEVLNG